VCQIDDDNDDVDDDDVDDDNDDVDNDDVDDDDLLQWSNTYNGIMDLHWYNS
jgi:hypothetical protein